MNHTELMAAWTAKNEHLRKPVAVPIEAVGTVYVRTLMVEESEYVAELIKAESNTEAMVMAWLLCDETGARLPDAERNAWREVFSGASRADYVAMITAARGELPKSKGDDAGN